MIKNIDQISAAASIERVISSYGIALVRKGNKTVALCPFHNDRNPSMSVDATRNRFKCWVCNTSGDSFDFVTAIDNLSESEFPEAVRRVASICGLDVIEEKQSDESETDSARRRSRAESIRSAYAGAVMIRGVASEIWHEALMADPARLNWLLTERRRLPESLARERVGIGGVPDLGKKIADRLRSRDIAVPPTAAWIASGIFYQRKTDLIPRKAATTGYLFPQFADRNREIIASISRKDFKVDCPDMDGERGYQFPAEVDVDVAGETVTLRVATDGRRPVNQWLNPRDLRKQFLIVVEGEHDALSILDAFAGDPETFPGDRWGVIGLRGAPSDDQLIELSGVRATIERAETYLLLDADGIDQSGKLKGGSRYSEDFSYALLEAGHHWDAVRVLSWPLARVIGAEGKDVDEDIRRYATAAQRAGRLSELLGCCVNPLRWELERFKEPADEASLAAVKQ